MAVAGIMLDKAIPVNRVYSFPKDIKCLNAAPLTYGDIAANLEYNSEPERIYLDYALIERLKTEFVFAKYYSQLPTTRTEGLIESMSA